MHETKHGLVFHIIWGASLLCLLLLSLVFSVRFGSIEIPVADILSEVQAVALGASPHASTQANILWDIRLPRSLFAALCGAGLAVCGLLLQTMTKNELADPYILGVSSGAGAGAVGAIVGGWLAFLGSLQVEGCAFLGAALATGAVLLLTGRSSSPVRLVLVGIGISAIFSALTMLLIYSAKHEAQVRSAMFWLLGSLSGIHWNDLAVVAIVVGLLVLVAWLLRHSLDVLLLGQGEAATLGMNVKRLQVVLVILSSFVVAVLVAKAGVIGFVGLITPHVARFFSGVRHGTLVLGTALAGAIITIWADVLARTLFRPEELPIGVLTSLAGAPVFLWIISRRYREELP